MGSDPVTVDGQTPQSSVVLDMTVATWEDGTACALLTPAIRAKLREMEAGQALEVRVNDLAARDDLASWCRLSGHALLAMREEPPGVLRAWVRKKGA